MENQDKRTQQIADLRTLVDFLAAHPDLPIGMRPGHYVIGGDDETGMAEITRVAAILDVEITGDDTTRYATRHFGTAWYHAFHVMREHMDAYRVELKHVEERRTCGCGGKLTDADLVAGKKRCAACVPGEAVES